MGALVLAGYYICTGYTGALPWTAHGVVCSFYINMAKSDHRTGGITFEAAKAVGFTRQDSPSI